MIIPYFGYDDASGAIEFLTAAFGFEVTARYDGEDGSVIHAELKHGDDYVMLGSAGEKLGTSAKRPEGSGTYISVDDVDEHFATAKTAGANIVYPPEDTEFGTRRYRTKDPEGYEWSFGSYAPGQAG